MKAAGTLFLRLIFITVFLFGGIISAADRNEPQEVPNPRKKEIPRITLKNISPPFKNYEYYRDYQKYGFQFNATEFNIINAWWLAEASTLVYADENFVRTQFSKAGLREVRFFDHQSTQCFVASNDKFAIIAFRGSEIWKRKGKFDFNKIFADLIADVDVRLTDWPGGGKVHRGFKDALDEVWLELAVYIRQLNDKGCKIWITGHSLGAALATLAADRYGNSVLRGSVMAPLRKTLMLRPTVLSTIKILLLGFHHPDGMNMSAISSLLIMRETFMTMSLKGKLS